jgi:N-acetylmuramoyl-L-alanine amidase
MGQTTKSNLSLVGVVILLCALLIGTGWLLGSGSVLAVDQVAQAAEGAVPSAPAEKPEAPADEALMVTEQVERVATRQNLRGMQPVTRTVPVGLNAQNAAETKVCTFVPVYVDGVFGGYSYLVDDTAYLSIPDFCALISEDCTEQQASDSIQYTAAGAPISASVNAESITANGRYLKLAHRTLALDGKLLLDLDALQRIFGATVSYDGENTAVTVDTATKQLIQDGESYYNSHEIYWLSRIIYAEANGQPFDGMIGVGNVVLNRVASSRFPNSVEGVVFEPGQFTPVDNGTIYNTPSSEAVRAAQLCLEGVNTVGNSLFFLNPSIADASWFNSALTYYTTIGGHAFYI